MATNYVYDDSGLLLQEVAPTGNGIARVTTQYEYDARGLEIRRTDAWGTAAAEVTTTQYHNDGSVWKVTDPTLHVVQFTPSVDPHVHSTSITDSQGRTQSETRDAHGNITEVVDVYGGVTRTEYDELDRPADYYPDAIGHPAVKETTTYDSRGRVKTFTDSFGYVTTYSYDDVNDALTTSIAGVGSEVTHYNARGEVASHVNRYGGTTSYTYHLDGQVATQTEANTNGASPVQTTYEYDANGNLWKQHTPGHNVGDPSITTEYQYDGVNRLQRVIHPVPGFGQPTLADEVFTYWDDGSLRSSTDVLGRLTETEYDALGRVAQVTTPTEVHTYTYSIGDFDSDGQLTRRTIESRALLGTPSNTPLGSTTTDYDSVGRPVRVEQPTFGGNTPVTSIVYDDTTGTVTTTNPLGIWTKETLGSHGSKTLESLDASQPFTVYQYYPNGSLQSVETLDQTIGYTYDAIGREKSITRAGGGLNTFESWDYQAATSGGATASTRTLPNGEEITYIHDGFGRTIEERASGYATTYTQSYTYTRSGLLATVTDRSSRDIGYQYDQLGREVTQTWTGGYSSGEQLDTRYYADGKILSGKNSTSEFSFTYDLFGNRDEVSHQISPFSSSSIDVDLDYGADIASRSTSLDVKWNSTNVQTVSSTTRQYDAYGRIDSLVETSPSNSFGDKAVDFGYVGRHQDDIYRYNSATIPSPSAGQYVSKTTVNRRLSDHLPTTISHEHIANGAVTSTKQHSIGYDSLGQVESYQVDTGTQTILHRDGLNRVDTVSNSQGDVLQSHTYDSNGTRNTTSAVRLDRIEEDGENRYEYDAEGNVIMRVRFRSLNTPEFQLAANNSASNSATDTSGEFTLPQGWMRVEVPKLVVDIDPNQLSSPSSAPEEVELHVRLDNVPGTPQRTVRRSLIQLTDSAYSTNEPLIFEFDNQTGVINAKVTVTLSLVNAPVSPYNGPFSADVQVDVEQARDLSTYQYDHLNRVVQSDQYNIDPGTYVITSPIINPAFRQSNLTHEMDYRYDYFGNLLSRQVTHVNDGHVDSRSYIYDDDRILLEFDSLGRLERRRTYAGDQLLAVEDLDFEPSAPHAQDVIWVLADHQGSPSELFVSSDRHEGVSFDAFGVPTGVPPQLWLEVGTGYRGMEWDPQLALYEVGGRFYDPAAGRYTSALAGSWLLGASNLYSFAGGSIETMSLGHTSGEVRSTTYWENFFDAIDPRYAGAGQAILGAGEVIAGLATSPTGVGALVALRGLDDVQAGLRTAFSGEYQNTITYDLAHWATGSETAATLIDIGAGLTSGAAASRLTRLARGTSRIDVSSSGVQFSKTVRDPRDLTLYRSRIDDIDIEEATFQVVQRLDRAAEAGDHLAGRLSREISANPNLIQYRDLIVRGFRRGGVVDVNARNPIIDIDTQALFNRDYDRLASSILHESVHYFDAIDGVGRRLGLSSFEYEFRAYLSQARFETTIGISTHRVTEAYQRGGAQSVYRYVQNFGN